jgi:hypothetical protein
MLNTAASVIDNVGIVVGLRAGAELRLRAVLQEQEKLPGIQGLKAGAE